jgi:hypothetical protein
MTISKGFKLRFVPITEIMKAYGVCERSVRKWIDSELLKGYKLPGSTHRRVLREEYEKFKKIYPPQNHKE